MPPKRRILVAFGEEETGPDTKRQKKIVVSIDANATNNDLANEIATSFDTEDHGFTLELAGGFGLRPQDSVVDTIRDDELVFARPAHPDRSFERLTKPTKPPFELNLPKRLFEARLDEPSRIQICFITAELARNHAKVTLGAGSAASNGIMAFDGEFISGNTSLNTLRLEAARVLGWTSEDAGFVDFDDNQCNCEHDTIGSCSCAIALEIGQHGLFSTLHCRFSLDGEHCINEDCPYSHVKLEGTDLTATPPHCAICHEFLGFPCASCMEHISNTSIRPSSVVHCALVQNAGCGHLHHAHCLGLRKGILMAGCASGCPRDKTPREASIFNLSTPHIIVAWDGDKINMVPVPIPEGHDRGAVLQLASNDVVQLIRDFLSSKGFASPGLSLRIHSRDPTAEAVRFTQSTLVSVCHSSAHVYQSHYRFELFPSQVPQPPSSTKPDNHIDLHTSRSPIIACGCTRLHDLFCTSPGSEATTSVVLYAVKRRAEAKEETTKRVISTKERTYLADAAWHPSVHQTTRGEAALLSSLYCFTKSVSLKGAAAESKVLSMLYEITRFPPAVRTLGILLLNRDALPEERTALCEALYHALKDFLSNCARGPAGITTNPNRLFEAVRILFAHIMNAASGHQPQSEQVTSSLEEVSLLCAMSNKPLTDPILINSQVVNREFAALRMPGGELYRPSSANPTPVIAEALDEYTNLKQLLSHCRALATSNSRVKSTMIFHVEKVGPLPSGPSPDLARVGRDFLGAIERANKTDLVTRGPLDLKSANVIPPQIVLDQEGLLAVFVGRGCGSTRDVNFFRPTSGGDTEVDVNDVSFALEKVIEQSRAEDTWQVDTFGSLSAAPIRPPDEAIVLCLDLSESMKNYSGVSNSTARRAGRQNQKFDHVTASIDAINKLAEYVPEEVILENAKAYLKEQHLCCHLAWKSYLADDLGSAEEEDDDDESSVSELLDDLGTMARRDVLRLSEEDLNSGDILKLAHFAVATQKQSIELANYLSGLLDDLAMSEDVGFEPYNVPRRLLDPKTGDLLLNPISPDNAPHPSTFVNEDSRDWFEEQVVWPRGYLAGPTIFSDVGELEEAVAHWISGSDVLPVKKGKVKGSTTDEISVTLEHMGQTTVWNMSIETTTRTLYCLANRATMGRYSRFTLRLTTSKAIINGSANITLGMTDLCHGGRIEISFATPHRRRLTEVTVKYNGGMDEQMVLLPNDASILSLLSYLDRFEYGKMSDTQLWYGLQAAGDGVQRGTIVRNQEDLTGFGHACKFESRPWHWHSSHAKKKQEKSQYLSRLDLLKELFNVFVNRASSFDTSVSLVLGLVTFSNKAKIEQEITPIFESFRQQLDKVTAGGDTAVYDALDAARRMLINYRSDLPKLRKRIIIVTDGADTGSEASAKDVCFALQKNGIVVDSVQVGTRSDQRLHAISVATGGYRFLPQTSLSDALSIFDLETMLSSAERSPIDHVPKAPVMNYSTLNMYGDIYSYPVDIVTISKFPRRTAHAKLQQSVKPVASWNHPAPTQDDRTKRIMRELKALVTDPHPQIDIYVNSSDMTFFKIILEAPQDGDKCPYQNGTFLLTCDLPESYPRDPPVIRFVTFILHPNVSKQGKVCLAELGRLWSSDITLKELFSLIYGLLLEPDLENPLEIQASLKYYDDDGTYAHAVAEAIKEHALKTREQWRQELADDEMLG